jgi:hypothetical protein
MLYYLRPHNQLLFTRTVQTVTGAPILEVDFVEMGALWLILHVGCRLISEVMSRLLTVTTIIPCAVPVQII